MGSEAGSPVAEALFSKTETLAVHAPLLILSHSGATCMFEFLVQAVSGLDLAAESPSSTLLPLSLPGFAKMPTTRVVRIPQSTAPLYLHQVGRSARTLTHTLAAPLTAGQMQDRVCLQAQDWDLTSSEGAPPASRSYLLPAWALAGGTFCPCHPPPPRGPR